MCRDVWCSQHRVSWLFHPDKFQPWAFGFIWEKWGVVREKMGSFSQGRSKTTAPKGCHELIPFPSDLLLCVLGSGWGPGKTLNHFLVLEAMCAVLLFYCICLAYFTKTNANSKWFEVGGIGQRDSARGKTVLRVMAVDQRLIKSKARKGGGSKRRCSKEGVRVFQLTHQPPPTGWAFSSCHLSPSKHHTHRCPPLNETCFLHHLFLNVILISLYHTWVWEKGSARSWGRP